MSTDIVQESQKLLLSQFESLYNNSFMSDVTFIVGSSRVRIFAHRVVLGARSSVFRGMFSSSMKEGLEKELEVPETTPEAFMAVLQYIYSGKIVVDNELLPEVLNLANYYDLELLKKSCSDRIEKGMNSSIVCSALTIAYLYKEPTLKKRCYDFIRANSNDVLEDADFLSLPETILLKILKKNDVLLTDELSVYNAIVRWGKAQILTGDEGDDESADSDVSDSSQQDFLSDLLKDLFGEVRFPMISLEDLDQIELEGLVDPDLLEEAKAYHATGKRGDFTFRYEKRTCDSTEETNKPAATFDFLLKYPNFEHLKSVIKANPKLIDPVVAELSKSNPELGRFIENNKQEFILLFQ